MKINHSCHYKWTVYIIICILPLTIFSQVIPNTAIKHNDPPMPIEGFFFNGGMNYQATAKKAFDLNGRFNFFSLATYSTDYTNKQSNNRLLIETQFSYTLKHGFGLMIGTDINQASGFSTIIGPQHTIASKQIVAVTIVSFFLNPSNDFKLFGLYEYKPPINSQWSMYNRIQFVYNQSLKDGLHNRSYLNFRTGFKRKAFGFGLGLNLDQFGPTKQFHQNFGVFTRWEFK